MFGRHDEDNEMYCETCDRPLKRTVDVYEYWGSTFSQSTFECTNEKCPECEDYDGSDDYLDIEEEEEE
jgi:hypothetical protein